MQISPPGKKSSHPPHKPFHCDWAPDPVAVLPRTPRAARTPFGRPQSCIPLLITLKGAPDGQAPSCNLPLSLYNRPLYIHPPPPKPAHCDWAPDPVTMLPRTPRAARTPFGRPQSCIPLRVPLNGAPDGQAPSCNFPLQVKNRATNKNLYNPYDPELYHRTPQLPSRCFAQVTMVGVSGVVEVSVVPTSPPPACISARVYLSTREWGGTGKENYLCVMQQDCLC